jgi:PAS domain S-box-containing protein
VQREAENGLEFAQRVRFGLVIDQITTQLGLIRTLRGLTPKFGCFDHDGFNERLFEQHLSTEPGVEVKWRWYSIRKLQARFFAGDYASAVAAASTAQRMLWTSPSQFETAEFHFYGALSHAASWDSASPEEKQRHFEALADHHRQLEIWAENCPENFEDRAALVGAEIARIEGRVIDAEGLYEKAMRSAHANGFIHNEAVAYEVAARFYAARGFEKIAYAYLREAQYGYRRWGADGKVKQLEQSYPDLRKEGSAAGPTSTIVAPVELLDLATVIKVSQAVSGEMVLEKLIDKLMRAAIQHAGAKRGLLILPRGVEERIEAEATTSGDDIIVHLQNASVTPAVLPESVIRYVMRTHEGVILDDASSPTQFSADSYIVQHRARSVLCLPLIDQARLTGVLYLENNLAPHVFSPNQIAVLKVIASQAAISLENTRLYRDLESREAKIRRLVDANVMGIFFWNLEGAIVGANEAFLNMVQYGREDLVSGRMRWTDLTPTEWRDRDARALAELMKVGTVQPYEKEFFRKNGGRIPVMAGGALFEESGREGVAFVLDLSEQKRAEEALRRNEAYLAEAQRLSHTGSWYWNVGTGEVVWSQEFFAIFGLDSEKSKASYPLYLECIHPEDRSRVEETRWAALRDKRDFEVEYRLLLPGGFTKYLHGIGHFLESHSGDVEYIGAVIDITERKKEESARRYSEERYRVVIETANDAVVTTDESGAILFANPATTRVFGYDPTELIGKPLTVLMPEFMRQLHENGFRRYLATGQRHVNWQGNEFTGLRKNGQEFPVEVSFGELTMNGRRVFTGFIHDISERKQAEEQREKLRRAQADLAHINRVSTMGELTASLGHEIKQPISAAMTDAQTCMRWLARERPEVAEAREAASRLIKDVTRANEIIGRIGSLFKKHVPKRELIDVNELIREMIVLMRSEASRYSISIHDELVDGLPKIMADRVGLQQVLMNLMLNGVEAMKDMTAPGTLTVVSRRSEDGQLAVSILDTGVGVPPDQIDQIFSAFITSKPLGTGMGLPISRSIIESHGGRLWATPNSGPGATFQFVLPIEHSAHQTA